MLKQGALPRGSNGEINFAGLANDLFQLAQAAPGPQGGGNDLIQLAQADTGQRYVSPRGVRNLVDDLTQSPQIQFQDRSYPEGTHFVGNLKNFVSEAPSLPELDLLREGKVRPGIFRYKPHASVLENVARGVANLPLSIANEVGETLDSIFIHPVETLDALGGLAAGAVEKIFPGEQSHEHNVDALLKHYGDAYGKNLFRTLVENPGGVLGDASMAFTGPLGLTSRMAGVAGKVGRTVKSVDKAIAPENLMGKAAERLRLLPRDDRNYGLPYTPPELDVAPPGFNEVTQPESAPPRPTRRPPTPPIQRPLPPIEFPELRPVPPVFLERPPEPAPPLPTQRPLPRDFPVGPDGSIFYPDGSIKLLNGDIIYRRGSGFTGV